MGEFSNLWEISGISVGSDISCALTVLAVHGLAARLAAHSDVRHGRGRVQDITKAHRTPRSALGCPLARARSPNLAHVGRKYCASWAIWQLMNPFVDAPTSYE